MQPFSEHPPSTPRPRPAAARPPGDNALELWTVSLASPLSIEMWRASMLDEAERDRSSRFRFERDRRRFVLRRAALRAILAERLGCTPGAVKLAEEPRFGRPYVDMADAPGFSTSHSGDLALIAVGPGADRGRFAVDLEETRPIDDFRSVARRFFAAEEIAAIAQHADEAAARAHFYRIWTAKEAFVKALGRGLAHPLDAFAVDVGPPPRVIRTHGAPECDGNPAAWSLALFEPRPGWTAALAATPADIVGADLPPVGNWSAQDISW
ncbi:hypothetical protein GCM10011322_39890 [Salinarimonas ramus]|uniref:4'-phosphopantetheinyl transferase n=2 Tax=Salinarimonas ramus TaxID=690164 RepID=A0A917V7H3_9HYPH|nr:hypothetical protein GCM10011322_39890 [Salinarimonas ramus]